MKKNATYLCLSSSLALFTPMSSFAYTQTVNAGERVSGETVNSGQQFVYGTADNTKITGRGQQYIKDGGVTENIVINGENGYTSLTLENLAVANAVTLNSGDIFNWGQINGLTMTGGNVQNNGVINKAELTGGTLTLNNGQNGVNNPYLGSKANNVTLTNASLNNRFGIDTETIVNSGGGLRTGTKEYSYNDTAISEKATINQGGLQIVNNGGTSIGSTVNVGGDLQLTYYMHGEMSWDKAPPARGTANESIVYGRMTSDGGLDNSTTVKSGGVFNLSGDKTKFKAESNDAIIEKGGIANLGKDAHAQNWIIQGDTNLLASSAVIDSSTVGFGGLLLINAGAANATTVLDGGRVDVAANATLNDASIMGTLVAQSDSNIQGNLKIQTGGQVEVFSNAKTSTANVELQGNLYLNNSQNPIPGNYGFAFDSLVMDGGSVYFAPAPGNSAISNEDTTSTLTVNSLDGTGNFYMNTAASSHEGNQLSVIGSANGQFGIFVGDTGANPAKNDVLALVQIGSGNADFQLNNTGGLVDIGTYQYEMVSDGQGQWFLKQKGLIPVNPVDPSDPTDPVNPPSYQITPSAASALAMASVNPLIFNSELDHVSRRVGDARNSKHENGFWGKVNAGHQHVDLDQANYKMDLTGVTFGVDHNFATLHGQYTQGGFASYTQADVNFARGGSGKVNSYSLGVYGTYLDDSGFYIDGIAKVNRFHHTSSPIMTSGTKATGSYNNHGFGVKVEGGKYFNFNKTYVTPFIGGSGFTSNASNYTLSNGMHVSAGHQKSVVAYAGVEVGHTFKVQEIDVKPYTRISVEHEFIDNNKVNINYGDRFSNNLSGTRGVIQTGINVALSNKLSLNLDTQYRGGKHIENPWAVGVSLNYFF